MPLRIGKQRDGHGVGILAQLAANELGASQHIAPLVIPAKLHIAAIVLEHKVKVIGLHNHIVEFQERKALFHTLLIALGPQHIVDAKAGPYLAQQLNVVQLHKPIGIIQHNRLIRTKFDETLHLAFKALGIVGNVLSGKHLAHIRTPRRIADHGSTAADKSNGTVSGHLQTLHQRKRHKMAGCKTIGSAVKANIECRFSGIDHVFDFFFIGHLCNQAAGHQLFINLHRFFSFLFISFFLSNKKSSACTMQTEDEFTSRYHLWFGQPLPIAPP